MFRVKTCHSLRQIVKCFTSVSSLPSLSQSNVKVQVVGANSVEPAIEEFCLDFDFVSQLFSATVLVSYPALLPPWFISRHIHVLSSWCPPVSPLSCSLSGGGIVWNRRVLPFTAVSETFDFVLYGTMLWICAGISCDTSYERRTQGQYAVNINT